MPHLHQKWRERCTACSVSACSKRSKRIAMVALPPCDDLVAVWLTNFEEVLPREFQGGFHRF